MNLRELAKADLALTLEDDVAGFGWPITVTDPAGTVKPMKGQSGDIHVAIDPDTGLTVSGRTVHVALAIASVETAFGAGSMPQGQADNTKKPWVFTFDDLQGAARSFIVRESMPDRTLGIVTCIVEAYKT